MKGESPMENITVPGGDDISPGHVLPISMSSSCLVGGGRFLPPKAKSAVQVNTEHQNAFQ